VVVVEVGEDHVLDLVRIDAELLQRPDHRRALHDQPGVDEVVALAADEERVRKRDHPRRSSTLLQRLVALEALGGAVDRRRLGLAVGDGEHVALGGDEDVDARHRRGD
jgi:hypothetical protein